MKKLELLLLAFIAASFFSLINISACNSSNYNEDNSMDTIPYKFLIDTSIINKDTTSENYGLLIFLHGSGERGSNLEKLKIHGPFKNLSEGMSYPTLVIAPQCPNDVWWNVNRLQTTLESVKSRYTIDESRIYLTGLSMGGFGTWAWACEYPEQFAAIAPICGGGDPSKVEAIKDIPTWVFHGAKDDVVSIEKSEEMVDALKKLNAEPKFTIYPEAFHDSWTETYENLEFYNWLFNQRKE